MTEKNAGKSVSFGCEISCMIPGSLVAKITKTTVECVGIYQKQLAIQNAVNEDRGEMNEDRGEMNDRERNRARDSL